MTTKKELRDALQRVLDTCPAPSAWAQEAKDAARAILARPARVVGYRVRGAVSGRVDTFRNVPVEKAREYVLRWRADYGGKLYRLVVR